MRYDFSIYQPGAEVGNFFIIRSCMGVLGWISFISVPLLWDSVNPSFPSKFCPSRLTVLELTTRISFSVSSQCPDFRYIWVAPDMDISRLLKHLCFVEQSLGSSHLEDLQNCSILSASSLLTKLLGLPVSASESISVCPMWYVFKFCSIIWVSVWQGVHC